MQKTNPFLKINNFSKEGYKKTLELLNNLKLNTVCIEANCPNRYECFSKKTATFMILGDICTRKCKYCNIKHGNPKKIDATEPGRIALAIKALGLRYAVITCVTRDDLEDGGAEHFCDTVRAIRVLNKKCKIELLISDLKGNWNALKNIIKLKPDVINHNIEVVSRLFKKLRPEGNYTISLELLKKVKELDEEIKTKSGFMVGLGETKSEIVKTLKDLREVGCDIVTIGQYLKPNNNCEDVKKFYSEQEFLDIKREALDIGFKRVEAGPLVRSSYHASEVLK